MQFWKSSVQVFFYKKLYAENEIKIWKYCDD